MRDPLTSAIAANRFGLGARPGDLETISGDGRGWLLAQLEGSPPEVSAAGLRPSAQALTEVLELRNQIRAARRADGAGGAAPQSPEKVGDVVRALYVSEVSARFAHALASNRPFLERLTQFWTNHFAISVDKGDLAAVAGGFEREAIRPNVLGHFAGLLNAVERHPAMLLYLDNQISTGPNSPAAQNSARHDEQAKVGINENLAREILELHTLGVGGGYTQQDVTTFAYVISGWSVGRPKGGQLEPPGTFVFRPQRHEPGPKTVLGKRYLDTGYLQGVDVLSDLATHPSTARFIATKLARHFVADDPPHGVVDQVARAFSKSGGHLPTVYAALIDSPEAWQQPLTKFKTPADYIVSSYRGLNLPAPEDRPAAGLFDQLGQRTYAPGSPAGWPDRSADWDGASALLKRIEWADKIGQKIGSKRDAAQLAADLLGTTLTEVTRVAISGAASPSQAITLLLAAPEFMRR
jgi:uncharacterized protein (DUF1800 family)